MNEQLKQEIKNLIREELKLLIPDFFGRSLLQIKNFFINQIK